jgi:recombination protein RecA
MKKKNPSKLKSENKLDSQIKKLEEQFRPGILMQLGKSAHEVIEVIPFSCRSLNEATGVGGLPRGRIIEIFGIEAGGKTSLALDIIASAQKQGGYACLIDAEHNFNPQYAAILGVDVEKLYVSQPDYGEQALQVVDNLAKGNGLDVIVIDSVSALLPQAELEGSMGDIGYGTAQAKLMSFALRKLATSVGKSKTVVIFINQIREKVGLMFGNPEITSGGRALKFYAAMRLRVSKKKMIDENKVVKGHIVGVQVVKNKSAAPFKDAEVELIYEKGFDYVGDIINLAVQKGIIQQAGAWYTYKEIHAQGLADLKIQITTCIPNIIKEL